MIDGKLVSSSPLLPGQSQFRVMYLLGGADGKARVEIDAPAPVGGMILIVPRQQAENATVEGLEKGEVFPGNGMPMQSFVGKGIAPGQKIVLTMTDMPQPVEAEGKWSTPQIMGIAGIAVLLILFVVILALKPGRKAAQASAETPGAKDA